MLLRQMSEAKSGLKLHFMMATFNLRVYGKWKQLTEATGQFLHPRVCHKTRARQNSHATWTKYFLGFYRLRQFQIHQLLIVDAAIVRIAGEVEKRDLRKEVEYV